MHGKYKEVMWEKKMMKKKKEGREGEERYISRFYVPSP
jgi:hypothetical protein